jgi:serine/threonine protein kinase
VLSSPDCPDPDRLAAFYDGGLPTDDHLRVARHLRDCPFCRERSMVAGKPLPARRTFPDPGEHAVRVAEELHETATAVDRVGPYLIHRLIGRGGMGAVYEAVHDRLGKAVALKVLPRTLAIDPEQLARFEREIRAVGKLDHPNVVRATDAGDEDGVPYLTMELVDGVDFARLLRAVGPMPVPAACEVLRQAAEGLAHAHHRGVTHRDVKPSNLMVTPDGVVKVLDLGLAVFVSGAGQSDERITTHTILGTHDYMAPEQWTDPRAVSEKVDVYGLGCVLHQALVGRPPFGGSEYESANAKRRAHLNNPLPDLSALRPDAPHLLVELIRRMTAKKPDDRPAAAAIAAQLKTMFPVSPPLGRLVERAKLLSSGTEFTDGLPTALAPMVPETVNEPAAHHTVTAMADLTRSHTGLTAAEVERTKIRPWEYTVALVLIGAMLIMVLAAILFGQAQ